MPKRVKTFSTEWKFLIHAVQLHMRARLPYVRKQVRTENFATEFAFVPAKSHGMDLLKKIIAGNSIITVYVGAYSGK